MVKLLEHGAYLAGNEIVEDLPGAAETLSSKTGQAVPSKEEAAKSTMAYEILQAHNTSGNPERLKVKFDLCGHYPDGQGQRAGKIPDSLCADQLPQQSVRRRRHDQ